MGLVLMLGILGWAFELDSTTVKRFVTVGGSLVLCQLLGTTKVLPAALALSHFSIVRRKFDVEDSLAAFSL